MKKVSDILREERQTRDLTIQEIESATKIKKEYLEAIEEGKFNSLPSESYALGFVKNYAKFLGLSPNKIIPIFRREYKSRKIEVLPNFRKNQFKFERKINAKFLLGLTVFIIVVSYIIFQYSSLYLPPYLDVKKPKDGDIIGGNVVLVEGKTDPYATVFIEGNEAYVDINGNFKKSIYVFQGAARVNIIAKNRFGKESRQEINIRVK